MVLARVLCDGAIAFGKVRADSRSMGKEQKRPRAQKRGKTPTEERTNAVEKNRPRRSKFLSQFDLEIKAKRSVNEVGREGELT